MKGIDKTIEAISDALNQWLKGDYNPFEFYCAINGKSEEGYEITRAMDAGTNEDVINAIGKCLRANYQPDDENLHYLLKMIQIQWF